MSPHKCDFSVYLQKRRTEPAVFSKSTVEEAHSLNDSFSSSSEFVLGWPKSSFGSFHNILWKDPNELFHQPQ